MGHLDRAIFHLRGAFRLVFPLDALRAAAWHRRVSQGQILIVSAFFPPVGLLFRGRMAGLRVVAGWVGAFVGVASPWLLKGFGPYVWIIVDSLLLAPILWLTWKGRITQATWSLVVAIGVLVFMGWNFKGSFTWLEIGFHYGSNRYAEMFSGVVYNIPSALAHLGWSLKDPSTPSISLRIIPSLSQASASS